MKVTKLLIIATICLAFTNPCWSSKALFAIHPSTRTVSCIGHSEQGLVVGTTGGLVIVNHNGRQVLLPGTPIRKIVSDGALGLFIATDKGLFYMEDSKLSKLWDKPVTSVLLQKRCLFLGSLNGRIVKYYRNIAVDFVKLPSQSPVHSIINDNGRLLAATVQGLWSFEKGQSQEEKLSDDTMHEVVTTLSSLGGRVFAGTPDGLFELRGKWQRLGGKRSRSIHVNSITAGDRGRVYVATAGDGLYSLQGTRLRHLRDSISFGTALRQYNNELYVGTITDGLLKHSKRPQAVYELNEEPPGNAITSLAYADETETLVVGTFDNGVGLAKGESWQNYRVENGKLRSNWISHVASPGKGVMLRHSDGSVFCQYTGDHFRKLGPKDGWPKEWTSSLGTCGWRSWAGTYSAFFLRSASSWKTVNPKPTLHGNIVLDVELLGNEAWVATHRNGLYRWDSLKNHWRKYTLGSGLTDTWVTSVESFNGEIWAGTFSGGLCRLASTEEERTNHPKDFLDSSLWEHHLNGKGVNCLFVAGEKLWIGTQSGLFCWDGKQFSQYGLGEGLPSQTVWAITSDGERLWVGTDVGLCSASLEEMGSF